MDGMLSQEEINALLSGMDSETEEDISETTDSDGGFLTDIEKDTVGEISNISMGTAATTLSSLVNQKVNISIPVVTYENWDNLVKSYDRPCVFLQIKYKEGLDGNNILILKDHDVKIIADLMMGGDGTNTDGELGELHLSAISEAMNQMMGSAATSLSSLLDMKIDISPPTASLIDLNEKLDDESIENFVSKGFVKNSFQMTIGDLVDSEIMQLFPVEFAKNLCASFDNLHNDEEVSNEAASQSVSAAPQNNNSTMEIPVSHSEPQMQPDTYGMQNGYPGMPMQTMPMQGMSYPGMQGGYPGMPMQTMPMQGIPMQQMAQPEVNVQPAQFQAFASDLAAVTQKENINLIMDVPLEVSVELGRTSKSIRDILEFAPGTIIELDKIAGEPIDVLVNGRYVAKGEVVVIEESFGIRVTEIIK